MNKISKNNKSEHYNEEKKSRKKQYARNYMKKYRSIPENIIKAKELHKKYFSKIKNKNKKKEYDKKYYLENKEKIKERQRNYSSKTENKRKECSYRNKKYKNDPIFKFKKLMRNRINSTIKNNKKSSSSLKLLGCSIEKARKHIETQFKEGMTWDNNNKFGWHIDHIKPCASFDLTDPEQQKQCFHYTNLQPLWWWENLSKSNKII